MNSTFAQSLFVAVFVSLSFCSCENPFTTRDPEPPNQNSSTFIPPTTPAIVFTNLQIAIQERNVENYMRSFVDTTRSQNPFSFSPDEGIAANRPGVFQNWQLEDERRYFTRLVQAAPADSFRSLRFSETSGTETANTADFTQNYEIVVRHNQQKNGLPTTFAGQSRFFLERSETGDWAIYRWEDIGNSSEPPWSELKAIFQ